MNRCISFNLLFLSLWSIGCGSNTSSSNPPDSAWAARFHAYPLIFDNPQIGQQSGQNTVYFNRSGIRLQLPEGFEVWAEHTGIIHPKTGAVIQATRLSKEFYKVADDCLSGPANMPGTRLLTRLDGQNGDRKNLLVTLEERVRGTTLRHATFLFDNQYDTILLTASFPADVEDTAFRSAIDLLYDTKADLRLPPPPEEPVRPPPKPPKFNLHFEAPEPLIRAATVPGVTTFAKDGRVPLAAPGDPIFLATHHYPGVHIKNRRGFTELRLNNTARTDIGEIISAKAITIDNLQGFEIIAEATERYERTPLMMYHVMLYENNWYIMMQGTVGKELADEYLPRFSAMAKSLKRTIDEVDVDQVD